MVKLHCWETYLAHEWKNRTAKSLLAGKGPVKLMQHVKIAHSFLQFVSHQFKLAYVVLNIAVKNFLKPTSKNVEMGRFNPSLLAESFYLTLKCH